MAVDGHDELVSVGWGKPSGQKSVDGPTSVISVWEDGYKKVSERKKGSKEPAFSNFPQVFLARARVL
jgi:hypothetical protein